ncbi:fumarylacetoacetate hydrolase family protein [Amycolatopsis mongoliensis]|uniref:Fumarylacetoacetate hydrolase family protein n=1 Tax=Amycolatopsis mongoliensis TaxID=715475 RepID=A0A9Y2JNR9_9PSEU|nr:fumarylacetoacetate hydrolase family protein [Amycolatopsis sp. 4-36]WIY01090.1 fumarylacetoacetate hydrolase family protein [Amycolatopsis sp. 4-36]
MKIASYYLDGHERTGIVRGDSVVDVSDLMPGAPSSTRQLLCLMDETPGLSGTLVRRAEECAGVVLSDVRLLPVITRPHAVWCAALTYLSHVREGGDRPAPDYPLFFLRVADSQMGHGAPMIAPVVSQQLDYEGELAVVIGRRGRHIREADALAHVAGYSCYNDGSVRDWQRHTSQITVGKNFAATGGFGPWLVTSDEIGDPYDRGLQTRLNGEVVQSAKISELLFSIEYMIAYLSTACTLEVGDVIVTGTCGGVGVRRNPPLFLQPGDVVEVEIDGIGTLLNPVEAEAAA